MIWPLALVACAGLPAQAKLPNAAELYSKAYAELQKELRLGTAEAADYPLVEEPDPAAFRRAPWPALLAKTAVARSLFEQAAASERCVLPTKPGALVDTMVQMGTMQRFVVAHAYSELKVLPDQTVADTVALLGHARHLSSQRRLLYSALALNFATTTLELCEATLRMHTNPPLPARSLRRLRKAVDRYKERSADLAELADQQCDRAREDLDAALAAAELDSGAVAEAKLRARKLVADYYRLLRKAGGSTPQDLTRLEATFAAELKKLQEEREKQEKEKAGGGEGPPLDLEPNTVKFFVSRATQRSALKKNKKKNPEKVFLFINYLKKKNLKN